MAINVYNSLHSMNVPPLLSELLLYKNVPDCRKLLHAANCELRQRIIAAGTPRDIHRISADELYLTTIMICVTFKESDESLNLVKNAVRLALVVLGEQEADLENVNNDEWM